MLKIKIVVDGQVFEFEGDAPIGDLFDLARAFLQIGLNRDQTAIDALTARAKASNDSLTTAVETASQ